MQKFNYYKQILLMIIAMIFAISISPKISNAQAGVPISTQTDFQSIMNFKKNFVLDKMATVFAKQILHKLTADVVNWINSGFEGNPAFLNNPGEFFLDAADQVTGAFLATNGPLSSLCSPFTIDIRLALALSQTGMASQRYTCTLGKIIEAQKNGPEIIVNGQVIKSASSASMNGFLGGDFSQGGWPAFLALAVEPNNNPYSGILTAQSDLNAAISRRGNVIQADLQMGQGFLSWSDCKDIPGSTFDPNADEGAVIDAVRPYSSDPQSKMVINKDGSAKYQTCEVKTPGSVISNSLEKNLNVPVTELELANDINAVVNALVTQMINKMLTAGLGSLSKSQGGSNYSYTDQIIKDSREAQQTQATLDSLQTSLTATFDQVDSNILYYNNATKILADLRAKLTESKACLVNNTQLSAGIDAQIQSIDARLDEIVIRKRKLEESRAKLEEISFAISGSGSAQTASEQLEKFNLLASSGGLYGESNGIYSQQYLNEAKNMERDFGTKINQYKQSCTASGLRI